jgi:hypothetical protein
MLFDALPAQRHAGRGMMENGMTGGAETSNKAKIAGMLLVQQVLVEAMIQHDAMGYHQLRDTLRGVLEQLEGQSGISADVLGPLKHLLQTLEARHEPKPAGQPPHAIDWAQWLKDAAAL